MSAHEILEAATQASPKLGETLEEVLSIDDESYAMTTYYGMGASKQDVIDALTHYVERLKKSDDPVFGDNEKICAVLMMKPYTKPDDTSRPDISEATIERIK